MLTYVSLDRADVKVAWSSAVFELVRLLNQLDVTLCRWYHSRRLARNSACGSINIPQRLEECQYDAGTRKLSCS